MVLVGMAGVCVVCGSLVGLIGGMVAVEPGAGVADGVTVGEASGSAVALAGTVPVTGLVAVADGVGDSAGVCVADNVSVGKSSAVAVIMRPSSDSSVGVA